jgi:hypothetical protein
MKFGVRSHLGITKPSITAIEGLLFWLGNRDSNPNYLIQNQAFYL